MCFKLKIRKYFELNDRKQDMLKNYVKQLKQWLRGKLRQLQSCIRKEERSHYE